MGACASKGQQISDIAGRLSPINQEEKEDTTTKGKKKKLSKAQKEVGAVLGHLKVPKFAVTKFVKFFQEMDEDESGSIETNEFVGFLELDHCYIPFIKRCFSAMDFNCADKNTAGALDPTEFTVGLYNLCIMTRDLLENYVFGLYDETHDGMLYERQVEKMVADSSAFDQSATKALVQQVFKALDKDNDGHISKEEFFHLDGKAESILRPMYIMQTCLQKKCLGESFWDKERSRMQVMLVECGEKTILDLLANRIQAKQELDDMKKRDKMIAAGEMEDDKVVEKKKKAKLIKKFSTNGELLEDDGHGKAQLNFTENVAVPKAKKQKKKKKKKVKDEEDKFLTVKGKKNEGFKEKYKDKLS